MTAARRPCAKHARYFHVCAACRSQAPAAPAPVVQAISSAAWARACAAPDGSPAAYPPLPSVPPHHPRSRAAMTTTPLPFGEDALEDALDTVGIHDADIHTDYSGRAMCGDQCFGIVHDGALGASLGIALVLACSDDGAIDVYEAAELAAQVARRARTDSMGRQTITYFPGYVLAGAEVDA